MTEVENRIKMCLQERIDNMVNEVLSQAMLDPGRNIPEAVGAFDKNWIKHVIVAEVEVDRRTNTLCADELAGYIRGKLIDALESLADGHDFAIVNIGYEWDGKGTLCATYVLSAEKGLFAEWEEVTDNAILHAVGKYIANDGIEPGFKPNLGAYMLRYAEFEINVNI